MSSSTLCILYGLNEGPAMGRLLVKACEQAGIQLTDNPETADIILAHSGGCLLVPATHQARLVIMVGFPYWPGHNWLSATCGKVWQDYQLNRRRGTLAQWLHNCAYHCRYALRLRSAWNMFKNLKPDSPWNSHGRQVFVRNRHDTYCMPDIHRLPFRGPRTFLSFSGQHDDCWDNPEPYIQLLGLRTDV
jgi:hypothetical protein